MIISKSEHPGWLELTIQIHPVAHEAVSAFLFDLGCKGVVFENSSSAALKAYLLFQKNWEDIQRRIDLFLFGLKDIFPEARSSHLKISKIEDQDWSRNWRRFFRPNRITRRLTVLPAWEPVPRDLESEVIRIDPGPAFGTGQHPTTRMCLEALEKVALPVSWSMLDVGTGSGILAIYGAKLGADRVVAIDIDPEAVRWAEQNILLNDLLDGIECSSKPLEKWDGNFSLVTANLTLDVILDLSPHFARLIDKGGWLVLSGILRDQVRDMDECLARHEFNEDQVLYQDEWACIIARKRNKA